MSVVGFSGYVGLVERLRGDRRMNPGNLQWPVIKDQELRDIVVPVGDYACDAVFIRCLLSGVVLRDVSVGYLEAIRSTLSGLELVGVDCRRGVRVSDVVLRDSVVEGVEFVDMPRFGFLVVENSVLRDVVIDGQQDDAFELIRDSVVSGVVRDVRFTENRERSQCVGLDLSEALIPGCIFNGIDMGRVKCNPVWEWMVIDDWFEVVPEVLRKAEEMKASSDKIMVEAGHSLRFDVREDERQYGRPLDKDRGAKYLDLLDVPWVGTRERRKIHQAYADIGIIPMNL